MTIRQVMRSARFETRLKAETTTLQALPEIVGAAALRLERTEDLTIFHIVGYGARSEVRCIRSVETPAFPRVNIYFFLDSTDAHLDTAILDDLLIER